MNDRALAYLGLRLALGANILAHGMVRFASYDTFVRQTVQQFSSTILPAWSVSAFTGAIPIVETIIGTLLLLGLWTRAALVAGQLLMIQLMIGMTLLQKWDIVGIQMIYVLFYFALTFLHAENIFSLDRSLLAKRRGAELEVQKESTATTDAAGAKV